MTCLIIASPTPRDSLALGFTPLETRASHTGSPLDAWRYGHSQAVSLGEPVSHIGESQIIGEDGFSWDIDVDTMWCTLPNRRISWQHSSPEPSARSLASQHGKLRIDLLDEIDDLNREVLAYVRPRDSSHWLDDVDHARIKETLTAKLVDCLQRWQLPAHCTALPESNRKCQDGEAPPPNEANASTATTTLSNDQAFSGRPGKRARLSDGRVPRDSDSEDELEPPRRRDTSGSTKDILDRNFACPFFKSDPATYRSCSTCVLKDIRRVKQHLWRNHTLPLYCPICQQTFSVEAERDRHIVDRACPPRSPRQFAGINVEQRERLSRRSNPGDTKEMQWFKMWDIVFPGTSRPRSPYVETEATEIINHFSDLVTGRLRSAINEAFPEMADKVNNLATSVLEDCARLAVDRWRSILAVPNQTRRQDGGNSAIQDFLSEEGILRPQASQPSASSSASSRPSRKPLPNFPRDKAEDLINELSAASFARVLSGGPTSTGTTTAHPSSSTDTTTSLFRLGFDRTLTASPGPLDAEENGGDDGDHAKHDHDHDHIDHDDSTIRERLHLRVPSIATNIRTGGAPFRDVGIVPTPSLLSLPLPPSSSSASMQRRRGGSAERHRCHVCGSDYGRRDNLLKHIRLKHEGPGSGDGRTDKRRVSQAEVGELPERMDVEDMDVSETKLRP